MHQGATWLISWFGRLHSILEKTGLSEGKFFLLEYGNHFNLWGRHCWVPIPSPFSPSFLLIELRVSRVEMSLRGASLTPNKGHFTQIWPMSCYQNSQVRALFSWMNWGREQKQPLFLSWSPCAFFRQRIWSLLLQRKKKNSYLFKAL